MNIGRNIAELRKQKNIKQEELATELGVTAAAVSKWENGYTLPDILMLCALADFFGVTTDDLLGRNIPVKEAVVVAQNGDLAAGIKSVAEAYGFSVISHFSAYGPALAYVLSHQNCRTIFTGGPRELISPAEIEETPSEVNSMHIIGNTQEDILRGFEKLCDNLHLFD